VLLRSEETSPPPRNLGAPEGQPVGYGEIEELQDFIRRHRRGPSATRLHRTLEVDADAQLYDPRIFGYAVHPILLGPSTHDDQVAGPRSECDGAPSVARLDQEPARGAQGEHRRH
jgi:hypothetical protein